MTTPTDECCPPPAGAEQFAGEEGFDEAQFAAYANALGHPARVAIIRLLLEKDTCICGEIVDELPLAQSTVSQHLKKLKDAGLIRGEVDGPRVCYCIEPAALARFGALAEQLVA
jgi:ArsR family transcriptional regulator, arsenate/arsenite/antimonite-responsive transcriptional repressor